MAEPKKASAAPQKSETSYRDELIKHALGGVMSRPYPGKSVEDVAQKIIEQVDAVLAARESPAKEREPEKMSA